MNTTDKERNTHIISVAIIAIATVIGIASIVISVFIASSKKHDGKDMRIAGDERPAVEDEMPDNKGDESNGGTVLEAPEPDGDFNPEFDEAIDPEGPEGDELKGPEEPHSEDADIPEKSEENDNNEGDAETGEKEETDEADSDEITIDISVTDDSVNCIPVDEILDSCYASTKEFDYDKLKGDGKRFTNSENGSVAEFEQCIFTTIENKKTTDDCLFKYAKDNQITDVDSAIAALNLDFADAVDFGGVAKVIKIHSGRGEGKAILTNNHESLQILIEDGEETIIISFEKRNSDTTVGYSTYMLVGFWQ